MSFVRWLHDWQDLAGAIIGALVGGLMGFWGAHIVARSERDRERRAAVRSLILDLVSFKQFADATAQEAKKDKVLDTVDYPPWLARRLEGHFYRLSPLFDNALASTFGQVDPELPRRLTVFASKYRELEARASQISNPSAPPLESLVTAFDDAHKAAKAAVDLLASEYAEMFRKPLRWWQCIARCRRKRGLI